MNKKVLLIGGAGYIGSVLIEYLLHHNYRVHNLDALLYNQSPYINNHPFYKFIHGDFLDSNILNTALQQASDVVILAGLVGDYITQKYPILSEKVNYKGMINLFKILKNFNLKHVIFISTCSNYGFISTNQTADENFKLTPLSLYAKAKVGIEKYILSLKNKVSFHPTILRFSTAFGLSPRMRFDLTVNQFIFEMYKKKELLIYDADTWRPYCHVKDLSRAIHSVLEAPLSQITFEVFNVGGNQHNYTKKMLIEQIKKYFDSPSIRYINRGPDPRNYKINFSKIHLQLGFEPQYTVSDGAQELITAFNQKMFSDVIEGKNYGNYETTYSA